ncbi:MAG: class I SAM-dependent methyltransferase, partial [Gammaproteobacteria bacterium]
EELRGYFEKAYASLNDDGILFMDMFGGTECQDELEEETELDDVDATYIWEHAKFNPINNNIICHIHFEFADGSRLEKAFTYNWRLWSLPEIRELLLEAGFRKASIYWEEYEEGDDDDDEMEGTGEYYATEDVENQESWMVYIVAEK